MQEIKISCPEIGEGSCPEYIRLFQDVFFFPLSLCMATVQRSHLKLAIVRQLNNNRNSDINGKYNEGLLELSLRL